MAAAEHHDRPGPAGPTTGPDDRGLRLSNGLELRIIGDRVRSRRSTAGWSLQDLADRAGISSSMLSDVERGRKVPSVLLLDRVATALGTSLAHLVQPPEPGAVVVRRRGEQQVVSDPSGWERRILSPVVPGVEFELMRTTLGPGVDAGAFLPHGPGSREYVAVEDGVLELTVGEQVLVLEAGDAVYHDGDVHHAYRNPAGHPCVYYLVLDLCRVVGSATGGPGRHR